MTEHSLARIGIDIGGTKIRAAVVDLSTGEFISDMLVTPTPNPATVESVTFKVLDLVSELDYPGRIGCALPGVITDGQIVQAYNLHSGWGTEGALLSLGKALKREVIVLNDADAVGLAETHLYQQAPTRGLVVVLTFGTGVGSAILHDNKLIEGSELGELTGPYGTFEKAASAARISQLGLSPEEWAARAQYYFSELEALLSPSLWIIAGGLSTTFHDYFNLIETAAPIRAAQFGQHSGVVGAAIAAIKND